MCRSLKTGPTLIRLAALWMVASTVSVSLGCKSREPIVGEPQVVVVEPASSSLVAPIVPPRSALLPEEEASPYIGCPVTNDVDKILDEAGRRYDGGEFRLAHACAELAADLIPQAVEAHHLRAAALAALGQFNAAQVAFAMALALDPDDPETLAAAADFYINIMPPRQRATIRVGLEYARRGSERAATRRRLDRSLRARLFLLEAEALNDLGAAETALPRIEDALRLAPGMIEAVHERGVTLFNLCRFRDAEATFLAVLREAPNDPYAHHHLGLIYERFGRESDAEAHVLRAVELAPTEFSKPVLLSREEFRQEVNKAISELPAEMQKLVADVSLELADVPALEDLTAVQPPFSPTITGLFRGLPLGESVDDVPPANAPPLVDSIRAPGAGDVPARAIVLYRKNLARAVKTRSQLERQIRRTLAHEIGHLQGLDEEDLRRRGLD